MLTLGSLIELYGVEVDGHLGRGEIVPVHTQLQFQGDVAVVPIAAWSDGGHEVPTAGFPVVRGESGGNTHLLLPGSPGVLWHPGGDGPLTLGFLTVPPGGVAYLAHPEHGYLGVGPGAYDVRRQREMADQVRLVAD